MRQEIIDLYDEYTHAPLDRRTFLRRLATLAGGTAAAYALLPVLENNYAQAAIVAPDDERIAALRVYYPGSGGSLKGYLARPKEMTGRLPAVLVIHENRGLNPHIMDVTRRFALAGFLALAPDLLTPAGGTPANEDQAREMIGKLDDVGVLADLKASHAWLKGRGDSNGRVGAVGFCWGGGMTNRLATLADDLAAAVVYYGAVPNAGTVQLIQAPLLLHYAGLDQRINAGIDGYEKALQGAGKRYTKYVYAGANHAFNNDTNSARYDAGAAGLAWDRTLRFLDEQLRA
ncbi:MAG TPA: dienelactone hydrolase family protein [Gammaproteobacteria bacterium]